MGSSKNRRNGSSTSNRLRNWDTSWVAIRELPSEIREKIVRHAHLRDAEG